MLLIVDPRFILWPQIALERPEDQGLKNPFTIAKTGRYPYIEGKLGLGAFFI